MKILNKICCRILNTAKIFWFQKKNGKVYERKKHAGDYKGHPSGTGVWTTHACLILLFPRHLTLAALGVRQTLGPDPVWMILCFSEHFRVVTQSFKTQNLHSSDWVDY